MYSSRYLLHWVVSHYIVCQVLDITQKLKFEFMAFYMIGFQTIYLLNEQWYYNFSTYLDMSMAGKYRPVPNLLWQPMVGVLLLQVVHHVWKRCHIIASSNSHLTYFTSKKPVSTNTAIDFTMLFKWLNKLW